MTTVFEPGAVHSGWTLGAQEVRGASPRWAAERGGEKGSLSLFSFSGPRGIPHQKLGRKIAGWRGLEAPELAPVTVGDLPEGGGLYVIVPALKRLEGRLAPVDAVLAIKGAAKGLALLHERQLVHGALDAASVQRTGDGARVVLVPPGLRLPPPGVDKLGLECDPRYAAPEVLDGRAPLPASDVFSLGLVLYRLLAGRPPVPRVHPGEAFILRGKLPVPDLPADVPPPIQALYVKMTALLPEQRPSDGAALLADIALVERGRSPARAALPQVEVAVERVGGAAVALAGALALAGAAFAYAMQPVQDPLAGYSFVLPAAQTPGAAAPADVTPSEDAPDSGG